MSGGAMANFVGLKCARDMQLGLDVREQGVRAHGPVALYASEEAHVVIRRAADMLGLGAGAVRAIAIDGEQRMRTDALAAAIERDVAGGVRPLAICATAGTTTTGSIDPLPEIAGLAAEHGLWLHVDAAYGGGAVLSDELRGAAGRASSTPTRSPSTRTSGSTPPSRPAACCCATSARLAARSTPTPPTSGSTRRRATASTSRCTGRSSRAASRR